MTPLDIIATPGKDRSHCVVAFTGYQGELMLDRHEFFRCTEALDYSRILVSDPAQSWYQLTDGGPWSIGDAIREQIRALAPQTVTVVGASAGGFAALLSAAEIGAQVVQAFGAQTTIEQEWMDKHDRRFHHALPPVWEADQDRLRLDAVPTLWAAHNMLGATTRYHLHFCAGPVGDSLHAARLVGIPGVQLHPWPCPGHAVARYLRETRQLAGLLSPEAS